MKLLVTGGAGFIGSNFIHFILSEHSDWKLVNLDNLTYAGNLNNLADIRDNERYTFIKGSIADSTLINEILGQRFDAVVNFAAESHVDRSIQDSSAFIETNVKGTQVLLEGIRRNPCGHFVQISTDEVYGSSATGKFTESSPILPNNPYAASKAAADLLCRSYFQTYKLPITITRCSNNFGPFQFPEKLIPLSITNIIDGKQVPIYGDGLNVRDWIYVEDHCRAIEMIIQNGKSGEIYNIGASCEKTNLELLTIILHLMQKSPESLIFVKDRLGHDRRYAMDSTKIRSELGWKPTYFFESALETTVNWYLDNRVWWERIKRGEHTKI